MNRLSFVVIGLITACAPPQAVGVSRPHPVEGGRYDVVILGGRVMDPESGLDGIRNLGIRDGRVAVITEEPIDGTERIDARGLVVAPGFIDLYLHAHTPEALSAKVLDGVTAAFEMELGVLDVDGWYDRVAGNAPIHFGTAVGHAFARMAVLTGAATSMSLPSGEG